jgi:PAS domain S-box-containing protein
MKSFPDSDHKQLAKGLKAAIQQLKLLLKHSVDSIVVVDLHFKVVKVNRAFEDMFGWTEQEVIGGELPTIPDFLIDEFSRFREEMVNTRYVASYEAIRQRKDGRLIDVSVFVSPLSDTKGNIAAFVAILRDITERKRMEEVLKERERQLRTLINSMPDIVCFKDGEGRWIEANEFCLRIFQLENLRYQGKRDSELADGNDFYRQALLHCEESDKQAWESGCTIRSEEVIPQVNGESKVFDMIKVPLFYSDERRKGLVIIGRDITELKRTEELLRKSEKLSVVGQLAAGIAHEIRNPLTSVKGFIQFMREGNHKNEYFHTILAELDRIEFIVNELVMLAKPQLTNVKPSKLPPLLHQVIALVQTEAVINNVQIVTEFESPLPMIPCDENQIKQVFINLVKNSIEAMPGGGQITVQLKQQRDAVLIRIIDQGHGISEERIQKLGEPFYSTKEKGTGLGLMTSYKIVQNHHGNMQIQSQKDVGTTVEVCLPVRES